MDAVPALLHIAGGVARAVIDPLRRAVHGGAVLAEAARGNGSSHAQGRRGYLGGCECEHRVAVQSESLICGGRRNRPIGLSTKDRDPYPPPAWGKGGENFLRLRPLVESVSGP